MSAPSRKTTDLVDERDGYCCVRCDRFFTQVQGGSRHHRKSRRDGDHSVPNLVLLCGSGTTGCHGWAHHNVAAARAVGLIIPVNRQPALTPQQVPVLTTQGWVLLTVDGRAVRLAEEVAVARLIRWGMRDESRAVVVRPRLGEWSVPEPVEVRSAGWSGR